MQADAYPKHFRDRVLSELRQVPGFIGAQLARRDNDGEVEFLVLTQWQSMDTIRACAGTEAEKAVVEPGAAAALVGFDEHVRHYEVVETA